MSVNTAPQIPTVVVGETNNFAVSFANVLDAGELLVGVAVVVEEATSDLAIDQMAVNARTLSINGRSVQPGKAVQFRVAGQQEAHSPYTLRLIVTTDSNPPQTKVRTVRFLVEKIRKSPLSVSSVPSCSSLTRCNRGNGDDDRLLE